MSYTSSALTYKRCLTHGCMRKRAPDSAHCSVHCATPTALPPGTDRDLAERWTKEDFVSHLLHCSHCKDVRAQRVPWNWTRYQSDEYLRDACIEGRRLFAKWVEFDKEEPL